MTEKKKVQLTLDATGIGRGNYAPSRGKRLSEGTPKDVRDALGEIALIVDPDFQTGDDWSVWLSDSDRRWLATALRALADGVEPKKALRLSSRRTSYSSLCELGEIEYQLNDLKRQGASKATALALIASYRLGFDQSGKKPVQPTPAECNAEVERLKKMLGKKTKAIFP